MKRSTFVLTSAAAATATTIALPAARYVVIEGMNHVLKHAPDTSSNAAVTAGYIDPALQIEPLVVDTVAAIALAQT
ncbi:MAG: hypothetical protein JWM87_235 [Candidatus Eremiobacteraeota bacterium]|nr:hypothetical protein [Candidatus Eremiobacteraeota bacterium]